MRLAGCGRSFLPQAVLTALTIRQVLPAALVLPVTKLPLSQLRSPQFSSAEKVICAHFRMIFAVTAAKINGKTRLKTTICYALGKQSDSISTDNKRSDFRLACLIIFGRYLCLSETCMIFVATAAKSNERGV